MEPVEHTRNIYVRWMNYYGATASRGGVAARDGLGTVLARRPHRARAWSGPDRPFNPIHISAVTLSHIQTPTRLLPVASTSPTTRPLSMLSPWHPLLSPLTPPAMELRSPLNSQNCSLYSSIRPPPPRSLARAAPTLSATAAAAVSSLSTTAAAAFSSPSCPKKKV